MASYLRPRRGKKATAISQNIILKKGEVFFEVPDGGVGTGAGKIKMGDGTTAYGNLPYFYEPAVVDVSTAPITFTESSETNNTNLLNAITTGAQTGTLFGNIKKLLRNLDTSVTSLNNDLDSYLFSQKGIIILANEIAQQCEEIHEELSKEMINFILLYSTLL